MSDGILLGLGCAVSFIAAAGFYVYLAECWTAQDQAEEPETNPVEPPPARVGM